MPAPSAEPGPTHLLTRGDPTKPGAEVRPAGLASVSPALILEPGAKEARSPRGPGAVDW